MSELNRLPLVGFAHPRVGAASFVIPLFGSASEPWIQDGKGDGLVSRFFPCSVPAENVIKYEGSATYAAVGDDLIYAFLFNNQTVEFGTKPVIQKLLQDRLDEFAASPFLSIEILKFLGRIEALPGAIRTAAERLADDAPDVAKLWERMMQPAEAVRKMAALPDLFSLVFQAPRRTSLSLLFEERVVHPLLGDSVRKRLFNLAHLYDPRVPLSVDIATDGSYDAARLAHPMEWVLAEGPRPDWRYCFQRLRALWLVAENRSGQIANDPVLPFRHQAALLQFLTDARAASRVLVADEVGLGKTVEAGLLIRHLLRQTPSLRILYLTLGGLVANVLEEFQRLDLPRFYFYANIDEGIWRKLNALPAAALTGDTKLVVASMHKLCETNRWQEQHGFLGSARYDLVIVDECHTLRAYGSAADSPQIWFRNVRELLDEHLVPNGRVLFLSATPHQGRRDVFLNLVALCIGTPLNASEDEKAQSARGRIVFRVKEHVRDWDGKRIFPPRDVRKPRLAGPPSNYQGVLSGIGEHFDWIARNTEGAQARAVGFVKSQALQYAASSLRAGFAYLLRRLVRYYPEQATKLPEVEHWASRLLPYRQRINSGKQLLEEWIKEFKSSRQPTEEEILEGELQEDLGPKGDPAEVPRLLDLLQLYNELFDDPSAGAKFNALFELLSTNPEPVVVFSQAVDTVYELEQRLKSGGFEVYRLTGDMPMENRPPVIRAFCRSTTPQRVLLSSAAGGVGINLQVARIAVHFDLPWNPMVLEQRVGRVHRIGSTRTILVETILLEGSREAEVFDRITHRLQEIVRDLSADPVEREALFRRILASLDPDALREMFSGEIGLEAVGAAVEAGRRAVDEADKYMRELAAQTRERHGRASVRRLQTFLSDAHPEFKKVGSRVYAVVTEGDDGELRQDQRETDIFQLEQDEEPLVFDRTAASYLGLKRSQTGGLGNSQIDPLVRAAIEVAGEEKSRTSTWVSAKEGLPPQVEPGDIIYFAMEACTGREDFTDPILRAWRIRHNDVLELNQDTVEGLLWDVEWTTSRKAGDVGATSVISGAVTSIAPGILHFPIATIGIRDRAERT